YPIRRCRMRAPPSRGPENVCSSRWDRLLAPLGLLGRLLLRARTALGPRLGLRSGLLRAGRRLPGSRLALGLGRAPRPDRRSGRRAARVVDVQRKLIALGPDAIDLERAMVVVVPDIDDSLLNHLTAGTHRLHRAGQRVRHGVEVAFVHRWTRG